MNTKTFKQLSRRLRASYQRPRAFRRLQQYHAHPRSIEDTIHWGMDFGGGGAFRVTTRQIPSEILSLAKVVEGIRPKRILEIGTFRGGTLLIWASLAERQVISCDLQDMRLQGDLFRSFVPSESACQVTLLAGNSHEAGFRNQVEEALNGKQVDFLFIDGDHTEAGVEADYRDYSPLVRPGGIIAFHDIVQKQPLATNQVYYFWKRLAKEVDCVEIIADPKQCGYGIGYVRVPEN